MLVQQNVSVPSGLEARFARSFLDRREKPGLVSKTLQGKRCGQEEVFLVFLSALNPIIVMTFAFFFKQKL